MSLVTCPTCHRHLRAADLAACPFCARRSRRRHVSVAAAFALVAATASGCAANDTEAAAPDIQAEEFAAEPVMAEPEEPTEVAVPEPPKDETEPGGAVGGEATVVADDPEANETPIKPAWNDPDFDRPMIARYGVAPRPLPAPTPAPPQQKAPTPTP